MRAYYGRSGGMPPPQGNFEFRSSQIASGTNLLNYPKLMWNYPLDFVPSVKLKTADPSERERRIWGSDCSVVQQHRLCAL